MKRNFSFHPVDRGNLFVICARTPIPRIADQLSPQQQVSEPNCRRFSAVKGGLGHCTGCLSRNLTNVYHWYGTPAS